MLSTCNEKEAQSAKREPLPIKISTHRIVLHLNKLSPLSTYAITSCTVCEEIYNMFEDKQKLVFHLSVQLNLYTKGI